MARLDVLAALLEAVHHHLGADLMAVKTRFDTGLDLLAHHPAAHHVLERAGFGHLLDGLLRITEGSSESDQVEVMDL
ncbi:hypothetical protein BE17_33780 [Sorangium cellulosum]|uniref:Uncharacterized protein n=1 Tax=Sorangium cellulosum TaxID=56 RepID=A0A150SP02_SORCE|nr:hypothetical protein BE17_33780 [Sorangium cellulosum]